MFAFIDLVLFRLELFLTVALLAFLAFYTSFPFVANGFAQRYYKLGVSFTTLGVYLL